MLDISSKDDMKSLSKHVWKSHENMSDRRQARTQALEEYVGPHYSKRVAKELDEQHRPLNIVELGVNVLHGLLIPYLPRVLISGKDDQLVATARRLTDATNKIAEGMGLESTLSMAILDAFFSLSVVRIYLCDPKEGEYATFGHMKYRPYVDCIQFEDLVFDWNARHWDEKRYVGHRDRMPKSEVEESKLFSQEGKDKILDTKSDDHNRGGDIRTHVLSQGYSDRQGDDDLEPFYDVWRIYLPNERQIVTFADQDESGEPVMSRPYKGPAWGPYLKLSFQDVPHQVIPLTPKDVWMSQQFALNELFNKVIGQEVNRLDAWIFPRDAKTEATNLLGAAKGRIAIKCDRPDAIKNLRSPGMDQSSFGLMMQLFNIWQTNSGNINLLGGGSATSETATQDQMLMANASRRVTKMQNQVTNFSREIYETLVWYLTYVPRVDIPISSDIGDGMTSHVPLKAEEIHGTFNKWNLEIDPYSGQDMTPAKRLAAIEQSFQIIMQLAPILQQQGQAPDMVAYLKLKAQYMGAPEITRLVRSIGGELMNQETPVGQMPAKMATSTRRYERVSKSAGGGDQSRAILQALGQQGGAAPKPANMGT